MAFSRTDTLRFKDLNLSHKKIEKLSNDLIRNIRVRKPKTYNYKALTQPKDVKGKVKFEVLGYIKDRKVFENLIEYLLSSEAVLLHHKKKGLENLVEGLLKKIRKNTLKKVSFVKSLVSKLTKLSRFLIYLPVRNVEFPMKSLKVGSCTLVKFTQYRLTKLRQTIKKVHVKNKKTVEWELKHLDRYVKSYLGMNQPCFEVVAYAGNSGAAIDSAVSQSEDSFAILIFLFSSWYKDRSKIQILSAKDTFKPREIYFAVSDAWGSGTHMKDRNELPVQIKKATWKRINRYRAFRIHELFSQNERNLTSFQKRIKQSILMFKQAMQHENNAVSFVLLTTILEMFLVRRKEAIKQNLRERYALIFSRDKNRRVQMAKDISDMYDIRCKIAHEGEFELEDGLLIRHRSYVHNFLRFLIHYNEDFKSVENFVGELNALKFTGKTLKPYAISARWV